ncbi:hypothetical protein BBK36DRAFT_1122713 [Trichoderma citrinoviride]|uniref:Nephrocystin 3-like N-terminal domain-containing protein n=1 Tax=Trichoderma citrinoviride TaxID=58853 RepID=A0A2T4B6Q6_9HYPO|nr:hypothetical protein BBK36DRAFT_1122713 [Trichoderma citrinoviride]PTB64919.1 hypothetical protein BBK36DRAFT_1122713 [Trichoderma citrinoviride]
MVGKNAVISRREYQRPVTAKTGVKLHAITDFTLEFYLRCISDERIIRMPERDSPWDRVLHAAQFFGLHISQFGDKVDAFLHRETSNGLDMVFAALASSHALLEIGHAQAQALLPTFTALYEFSILLTDITRIQSLETPSQVIQYDVTKTFSNLVTLLNNIAAVYRQKISDLKPGSTARIDFDASFGAQIEEIWRSKEALSDAIWKQKLHEAEPSMTVTQLRWKLQYPYNSSVTNRIYDKVGDDHATPSRTCYWLKDTLADFFSRSDQLLCVTGHESSGKTFLAKWVEERLARPLNVKSYHVLQYTFPFDAPNRATPTAFIKSILSTLLEQNISNVNVYKAIAQAFKDESAGTDSEPTEAVLWKTLHDCLAAVRIQQATMVIVIDDCDELVQGDAGFYSKLQECITGLPVRVVSFCRSAPTAVQEHERQIETSKVREDIRTYIRESLSRSRHFRKLSPQESDEILKGMVVKANGSWLWAYYAVRLVSEEKSAASIIKTSHDLGPTVADVLHKIVESLQLEQNPDLRAILSILLVASRSLTVAEIGQLLSIDLHKCSISIAPDVAGLISRYLSDLVIIKGGYVHFRTKTVRAFMKEQLGSKSLPLEQTAHEQLTLMMLLYVKLTLKETSEPSTSALDYDLVLSRFSADSLLGYVVQHWVEHFQASGFTGPELKKVFPNSITFALLERTCWTRAFTMEELVYNHKLALQVRQDCFGVRDITLLHTLVTLGYVFQNVFGSKTDAAWYFYGAAKLGREILSGSSTTMKSCMEFVIDYATMLEITDRIEVTATHTGYQIDIVTWYEEMLRLAIEIDRHRYGESSDEVLSWYQKLAKLYTDIGEEERAMSVYQEIRAIIIARDGTDSGRAKQMNAYFATLDIVLEGPSVDKIGELEQMIFEVNEDVEITDLWCIKLWLRLARSYESCDSFEHLSLAERLYVSLWQRITVNQAIADDLDIHLIRIDIALEYARFLCRHDRIQEACSILICLWAEYQKHAFDSEALVIRIRDVAEECRKSGLADIAMAMLTKVLDSFSSSHSEEIQKTVLLMNEVVEEITDTTVSKNTTTTTVVTEQTERVVRQLFERLVDQYEHNRTDISLFTASKALINLYNQQKNWRESEATLKKTLELTWNEILTETSSTSSSTKLCERSIKECLDVARQLGACYSTQGLFQDAEKIYWQIFKACISVGLEENLGTPGNPLTGAQLLVDAITTLVAFYEKHHRHREVIDVYTLVLDKYRLELGQKHKLTIRALYFLASYHNDLGLEKAYDYYAEILTVLNEGLDYCHQDAIKAALVLYIHYDARKRWNDLQLVCTALWETILRRRGKQTEEQSEITGETVASVYEKYSHVLDFHVKVDFLVLYRLAVEYREIIEEGYHDKPELVIKSLVTLAKICETSENHHEESIKAYEQVLEKVKTTKTTSTIEETTVDTVKKRLSRMYVTIVKGSQRTTISLDRAIEISLETYEQYRAAFKDYPEQTLNQLECLILLYQQLNTAEARQRICELLEASARYIITIAAVNMTLFHAATSLAALFVNAGMIQNGRDLLQEMRHKIIYGDRFLQKDTQSSLDAQMGKAIFIFLIAFGHGLEQHSESLSYTKIMAEIVLESLLYEEYSRVNHSEATLEVILQYGARLRRFWQAYQRTELIETLDRDLMDRFKSAYAHCFDVNCSKQVRESLYYYLMEELGKDRPTVKFDFETFMLQIGNEQVKSLLWASEFYAANQIGRFVFQYSKERNLYHDRSRIRYGYTLAQYLVGIGAPHPDDEDGRNMVATSQDIMDDVIDAFDTLEIDFERLRSEDLVGLIHLLQAQGNYEQLERVLSCLWRFKGDIHSTFGGDAQKIIEIGTCLVHTQCAQKRYWAAIETARQLYYNLQRARGRLDRETLEVARLVASIYATMASEGEDEDLDYISYAMDIHQNVLRELASPSGVVYNGYTRHDPEFLAEQAYIHSSLLKNLRLQLSDSQSKHWIKREKDVNELYHSLQDDLRFNETIKESHQVPPWQYAPPKTWRFEEPEAEGYANGVDWYSDNKVLETAQREWVLATRIFA